MIAEAVQTPTLTPQTIAAMADSVAKQADGIVHAMEIGVQRRQEMDTAMIEAQKVLGDATKHVSDALIEHVLQSANKPLEIETSVPAAA
jgi:hypothetical protein